MDAKYGVVQKLRNSQRGEGVADFVTYRYVYFEGGILWHSYVMADTQYENSKSPISFCCAVLFFIKLLPSRQNTYNSTHCE